MLKALLLCVSTGIIFILSPRLLFAEGKLYNIDITFSIFELDQEKALFRYVTGVNEKYKCYISPIIGDFVGDMSEIKTYNSGQIKNRIIFKVNSNLINDSLSTFIEEGDLNNKFNFFPRNTNFFRWGTMCEINKYIKKNDIAMIALIWKKKYYAWMMYFDRPVIFRGEQTLQDGKKYNFNLRIKRPGIHFIGLKIHKNIRELVNIEDSDIDFALVKFK